MEESNYSLGSMLPGVLAEQIVIDEQIAVKAPAYLTDIEAFSLLVHFVRCLFTIASSGMSTFCSDNASSIHVPHRIVRYQLGACLRTRRRALNLDSRSQSVAKTRYS